MGRRTTHDEGFTLIELLVTMFVIAGCLLGLIAMQLRALETTTLAKQRQQATQYANEAMEQLRAHPYSDIKLGHSSSDPTLTSDANIDLGTARFKPKYNSAVNEPLVIATAPPAGLPPLRPHTRQVQQGNVTFTVSVYVTQDPVPTPVGHWLTAVVSWVPDPKRPTQKKWVAVRSKMAA